MCSMCKEKTEIGIVVKTKDLSLTFCSMGCAIIYILNQKQEDAVCVN